MLWLVPLTMAYSTILLDLDHTLFDSDTSETMAFEQTLLSFGVNEPEHYIAPYQKINLELWAAVERGDMSPKQVRNRRFERLVVENNLDADAISMADSFVNGLSLYGDLFDGAMELLTHLSERVALALVTNGLSEVQRARLSRLGIDQYFDAIVISAEVGVAKPGTAIFDVTFDMLDRPAKNSAVMVGDNLSSDIQGGTNYGIATCWYNPDEKSAGASDEISHEIKSLNELTALVA